MSTPSPSVDTGPPRPKRTLWLTLGLGVIAFLPFALIFMQSNSNKNEPLQLSKGDEAALQDGLRMLAPQFTGRTPSGEPYVITADWALPNGPNPSRIKLDGIEASMTLKDTRTAKMLAQKGDFFPRTRRLRLEGGVVIKTSDGYRLNTSAATVNADKRTMQTDGPVVADGPSGSIRADLLEALDAGDRIVKFRGNVRLTLIPNTTSNVSVVPK